MHSHHHICSNRGGSARRYETIKTRLYNNSNHSIPYNFVFLSKRSYAFGSTPPCMAQHVIVTNKMNATMVIIQSSCFLVYSMKVFCMGITCTCKYIDQNKSNRNVFTTDIASGKNNIPCSTSLITKIYTPLHDPSICHQNYGYTVTVAQRLSPNQVETPKMVGN